MKRGNNDEKKKDKYNTLKGKEMSGEEKWSGKENTIRVGVGRGWGERK